MISVAATIAPLGKQTKLNMYIVQCFVEKKKNKEQTLFHKHIQSERGHVDMSNKNKIDICIADSTQIYKKVIL